MVFNEVIGEGDMVDITIALEFDNLEKVTSANSSSRETKFGWQCGGAEPAVAAALA